MDQTLYDIKIAELNVPEKEKNRFKKNGYNSIASILLEKKDILKQLGFSLKALTEIRKKAIQVGEKHGFGWEKVGKK